MKRIKKKHIEKVGGVFSEFKAFILRGNIIDLAIGVIIGGALQKIITALVDDIIMPLISLAMPKALDLSSMFLALDGGDYATLSQARAAGAAVLTYGSFLTMVLNFLLMAAAVFALIKGINALNHIANKDAGDLILAQKETKTCPFCCSEINPAASRCPFCTGELVVAQEEEHKDEEN